MRRCDASRNSCSGRSVVKNIDDVRARSCTFCQIVLGDSHGVVVFEDEASMAFLDRRPVFPGHCLIVPRTHVETLGALPAELVGPLFANVQLLCRAVEAAMEADGAFVAINNRVSQSVPHLHVHVVPRNFRDGLRGFFWPRQQYRDDEHMRDAQRAIRSAVDRIRANDDEARPSGPRRPGDHLP